MEWNFQDIEFLHPPDVFVGSFDNEKMQARHDELKRNRLDTLKKAVQGTQDPLDAMLKLHKLDHIRFLLNNSQAFRDAGRFEAAVLELYTKTNSPFLCGGDFAVWNTLFESCERERLSALGDPFPLESAIVYRISVTGIERGLSWTLSRELVKRFEDRWQEQGIGRAKIYTVETTGKNVLIYLKGRHDEEVVLEPQFVRTAPILEL